MQFTDLHLVKMVLQKLLQCYCPEFLHKSYNVSCFRITYPLNIEMCLYFSGGVGKYGKKGFSKKALGLGVGAGFLAGAAVGTVGSVATLGVYHRYWQPCYILK